MRPETGSAQAGRISAAANRLRLVQIHCADQTDDIRRRSLEAELEEAIKNVDPGERRVFLEKLMQEFPVWESRSEPAAPQQSDFDKRQLNDPDFLVERLKQIAPALVDEKRLAIARELERVGMALVGRPDWPKQLADEVRQKAGMAPAETIDANRSLEMLSLLMELCLHAEQAAWATWKDLDGATSPVKQPGALRPMFRKCLMADPNTPRTMVAIATDRLKQLLACFINVIPRSGEFAFDHFKTFSPETIEKADEIEGGGFFNREKRLWARYAQQFESIDEHSLENAIKKKTAEQIRKWMLQSTGSLNQQR